METFQKLLNNTPSEVRDKAREVTVSKVKMVINQADRLSSLIFKTSCTARTDQVLYDVSVELFPNEIHHHIFEKPSFNLPAFVSCSCPYYFYYVKYANAKVGSGDLGRVDGPPRVKNKKQIPYLCKHLYKASQPMLIAMKSYAPQYQKQHIKDKEPVQFQ